MGSKDLDLAEQVHVFGLSNNHTFGPNISLNRPLSLMFNYAKTLNVVYGTIRTWR